MLLLDEPLGALDSKLRQQMQVELRQLQRELGITTILVTHDQEEALTLSDRIVVLDQGRVQQIGRPRRRISGRPTASSPTSSAPPTCSRAWWSRMQRVGVCGSTTARRSTAPIPAGRPAALPRRSSGPSG